MSSYFFELSCRSLSRIHGFFFINVFSRPSPALGVAPVWVVSSSSPSEGSRCYSIRSCRRTQPSVSFSGLLHLLQWLSCRIASSLSDGALCHLLSNLPFLLIDCMVWDLYNNVELQSWKYTFLEFFNSIWNKVVYQLKEASIYSYLTEF